MTANQFPSLLQEVLSSFLNSGTDTSLFDYFLLVNAPEFNADWKFIKEAELISFDSEILSYPFRYLAPDVANIWAFCFGYFMTYKMNFGTANGNFELEFSDDAPANLLDARSFTDAMGPGFTDIIRTIIELPKIKAVAKRVPSNLKVNIEALKVRLSPFFQTEVKLRMVSKRIGQEIPGTKKLTNNKKVKLCQEIVWRDGNLSPNQQSLGFSPLFEYFTVTQRTNTCYYFGPSRIGVITDVSKGKVTTYLGYEVEMDTVKYGIDLLMDDIQRFKSEFPQFDRMGPAETELLQFVGDLKNFINTPVLALFAQVDKILQ